MKYRIKLLNGNLCQLDSPRDTSIMDALDNGLSYKKKNAFFMQRAIKRRFGRSWDGRVKLFSKATRCFQVGMLARAIDSIKEYDSKADIEIQRYGNRGLSADIDLPTKLLTKTLRPYQKNAVDTALKEKIGILEIATGGGKTLIASEIIRKIGLSTLFIVDRKELLTQTRKVFKKELGVRVGIIGDGEMKIEPITVATIQTLDKKKKALKQYLQRVNVLILDETHKAAAKTYSKICKMCKSTRYRIGLTGTAFRDDGDDMLIEACVGQVIYRLTNRDLTEMEYLEEPTITFHTIDFMEDLVMTYPEDYEMNVVLNLKRNLYVTAIANENKKKKILILTKRIEHAKILKKSIVRKNVEIITGKVNKTDRRLIMEKFLKKKDFVLIGTLSIFSEGIDIPDLDVLINASGNAGEVKTIQALGRLLRKDDKKVSCFYHDFVDSGPFIRKHSDWRIKAFENLGYKVSVK